MREDEFREPLPAIDDAGWNRRSFLKLAGFSVGATALTACSPSSVDRAIPYLVQPEEIVPGRSYWMASTCRGCSAGCGLLVKCRDGRPIKVEGIADHPISRGGVCAIGQAGVLELYDAQRLETPLQQGAATDWQTVDAAIFAALDPLRERGRVRLLAGTVNSPTLDAAISRFGSRFSDFRRVDYDALSYSAIAEAHLRTHGARVIPRYRFDRADVIVGLDADFLGTWLSPVEFAAGYADGRRIDGDAPKMSRHVQIEPRMTLTGSRADVRYRVRPSEIPIVLAHLVARIAERKGEALGSFVPPPSPLTPEALDRLTDELWAARGKALVVSGARDVDSQLLVNRLNAMLGSYGATIGLKAPSRQKLGDDAALESLLDEIAAGRVDALLLLRANPLYELPLTAAQREAIARVPLIVSFAGSLEETAGSATFVCPEPHFLETWEDVEAVSGHASIAQPTVPPLRNARNAIESLLTWAGEPLPVYDAIRRQWESSIHPRAGEASSFSDFWDGTLSRGFVNLLPVPASSAAVETSTSLPALAGAATGMELVLHPTVAIGDGSHAVNPWLQELPDPITKVTWDNCASISPATATRLGVKEGDVVRIAAGETTIELPAYVQPGQHDDVVAVALGYGREATERFTTVGPKWLFRKQHQKKGQPVGVNAAPLLLLDRAQLLAHRNDVAISRTGRRQPLATTQRHHTLETPAEIRPVVDIDRHIIRETTLAALVSHEEEHHGAHHGDPLWQGHDHEKHRWTMSIDLSACNGCSACVVSCQAENNIPVVGKDEVLREREMHWIRIDRYYEGEGDEVKVAHQPMLCHHCANASCESVCPVLATVHSAEGLNQQVYNRCVGTRYCANNCAFKARRFNWFDYPREDRLANMTLNPDVTVRSRGVMEKCSLCVQRIEAAKIEAKRSGVALRDGDIQPACAQSCPPKAIVFGDANDPESRIARARKDRRHYFLLEELNLDPGVGYLKLVRNRAPEGEGSKHV